MAKKKNKKTETLPIDLTEAKGLLVVVTAGLLFLSLISFSFGYESKNLLGIIGHLTAWTLNAFFGLGSYVLGMYLTWIGWRLLFNKPINHPFLKALYTITFLISTCVLLSVVEDQSPGLKSWIGANFMPFLWQKKTAFHLGGAPFYYIYHDLPYFNLKFLFNWVGVALIFSGTWFASLLFICKVTPTQIWEWITKLKGLVPEMPKLQTAEAIPVKTETAPTEEVESDFMRYVKLRIPKTQNTEEAAGHEVLAIQPEKNLKVRPSLSRKEVVHEEEEEELPPPPPPPPPPAPKRERVPSPEKKKEAAIAAQKVYNGDFSGFVTPPLTLLSNAKKVDQSTLKKDLRRQAEVLEETLLSFGIEAKVGQINCGPTITSFEVHPAIGVKVQKIKTLENDIALNMEAKSIRIIAPIPGKAAVGIEVPNAQPQEVGFKDMLQAYQQGTQKFRIPILLGKAVNGDYVWSDLTKMPHCIIAGATGSGKSVCINTIVMSILHNARPDEIKLVMVDPKKVELTPYSKLPHMLAPVITEPHGACAALNWAVKEMEMRYEILKLVGARNIETFNTRTINKEFESTLDREIPEKMYYIVIIIDELADLMMASSSDIETPIARIAQMARAVGIHLILATQRPSREVITGLIKANFPTRISFKVASRVNSQIVLDEVGAESLLGNGDMLFLPPGTSHLTRAQGAFIRDEDINGVIKHICDQAPPNYIIESFDTMHLMGGENLIEDSEMDDLYDDAVEVILSTGNASTTFLQRKLKIGYARAASIVDQMEARGVVGPAEGAKPRKILMSRDTSDEGVE